VPALRASSPDLQAALKESARGATRSSRRLRSALVVVEVALAMVLLVGAGLTIRSFSRLISVDPGFDAARVVTARVTLPGATYPDRARWTAFYRELIRRVSNVPGVEAAGLNSAVPLEGGGSEAPVVAEGDPMPGPDHPATPTLFQTISPDYFRAMGIQILEGRSFTEHDTADAPPVVIVDETLVRKLFPGRDPIGQRIAFELRGHSATNANPIWREVVGVVRHVHHYGLASEPPFVQLYTSFEQLPVYMQDRRPSMALLVRTTQQPDALAAEVRRALSTLDRNVPLHTVQTMEEYLTQNVEQPRLGVALLGGFGALALLLSIVGIYGVLSYIVSQRTQEMGVRMALGASRRSVLWLVLRQGIRLAALGIVVGLAASFVVTRALTSVLFQVSPHDPATFGLFAAVLAAAALVASAVPALRATRVNPIDALRDE
jgi:putative ABC transport system permease protein